MTETMKKLKDVPPGSLVRPLPAEVMGHVHGGNTNLRMLGVGKTGVWSCKSDTYVVVEAEPER